jgi:uncharacterized protein (DUF3084 family)
MTTTEIIVTILGALGGLGGISAFIKAFFFVRQDGDSKTISNLVRIIEEMRKNHNDLDNEFKAYKKEINERVAFFKEKFDEIEKERDNYKLASMEANRCKLPAKIEDCPVVQFLKHLNQECAECSHNKHND